MKKKSHITSFYLETLLLIVVFIAIILVLTQVFGLGRVQSGEAKLLTNAVCLAQNTAEAVSASEDEQALLRLLDENGNAYVPDDSSAAVRACYSADMTPDADGSLQVDVTWEPDGSLVFSTITVTYGSDPEPVYVLDTAVYLREAVR